MNMRGGMRVTGVECPWDVRVCACARGVPLGGNRVITVTLDSAWRHNQHNHHQTNFNRHGEEGGRVILGSGA